MSIKKQIRDEVERLSGYKVSDFNTCSKENYYADGMIVSNFWDLIDSSENIVIIGDYDVDGICASYIMAYSIKSV